jgi:hypothetical protein
LATAAGEPVMPSAIEIPITIAPRNCERAVRGLMIRPASEQRQHAADPDLPCVGMHGDLSELRTEGVHRVGLVGSVVGSLGTRLSARRRIFVKRHAEPLGCRDERRSPVGHSRGPAGHGGARQPAVTDLEVDAIT